MACATRRSVGLKRDQSGRCERQAQNLATAAFDEEISIIFEGIFTRRVNQQPREGAEFGLDRWIEILERTWSIAIEIEREDKWREGGQQFVRQWRLAKRYRPIVHIARKLRPISHSVTAAFQSGRGKSSAVMGSSANSAVRSPGRTKSRSPEARRTGNHASDIRLKGIRLPL
jgi:hypothetical protein